jgi:hypothetical protein
MQKGRTLHFSCLSCEQPIHFSIFDLDRQEWTIVCSSCHKSYAWQDDNFKRKFEALCLQIVESEEILADTAVGVKVGEHDILVPFKILLTRLNSHLTLRIADQLLRITFRIEPTKELGNNKLEDWTARKLPRLSDQK